MTPQLMLGIAGLFGAIILADLVVAAVDHQRRERKRKRDNK